MDVKGKIFLLDDDELTLSLLSKVLKKAGYDVYTESTTRDVLNKIKAFSPDIVMLDIMFPEKSGMEMLKEIKNEQIDTQVIMLTADRTAGTAVKAMKYGADDYLTKPVNTEELKIVISNIIEKGNLRHEVDYLRKAYSEIFEREIIGTSSAVNELQTSIEKIARARVSTVLITGESGTGKELISRHIHALMHKGNSLGYAPFVSVNCAAMPGTLLESELFGYEKGSFTDAKSDKKGLFEVAKGGSILLDEIGDMPTNLQSKLLRVLEERTIRRIGGKKEIPVFVTVLTTTNRNLADAVKNNEFRQDLFFRINTFYLHLVPLRERPEDIPILVRHFLTVYAKKYKNKTIKGFSREAEKILMSYKWPGNVRELKNLVERIVVLENIETIDLQHLPKWLFDELDDTSQHSDKRFMLPDSGIVLEEVEKDLILQALEKTKNNKTLAAKLLNISYDTLRYQLKKFDLK